MNVAELLTGYSKAMHSSWLHYKPNGLLFDCGEGVALGLSTKIYAIETVLIGHGHLDHIMGLPGFFFIRSAAKGDNSKPLQVVYPKGDKDIVRLREFIENSFLPPYELKFPVTWTEVDAGDIVHIGGQRYVQTFATCHDPNKMSVGYRIMENRKKLKKDLLNASEKIIKEKIAVGEDVFDVIPRNVLTYTGDTIVQDVAEYDQAEILIHECTFIDPKDVKYNSHSLLEDVLKCIVKYKPKNLLLNHFSVRYSPAMCGAAVQTKALEMNLDFPIWLQYGEYCWRAYDPKIESKQGEIAIESVPD